MEAPGAALKAPGLHCAQERVEVAPTYWLLVPAGQGKQGLPAKGPYVPEPQGLHWLLSVAPGALVELPPGHSAQLSADADPAFALYFPGAQSAQVDWFVKGL